MRATHHTHPAPVTGASERPCDRRGLALTTSSSEAAALYREAIERVHGAEAGAAELLELALAHDPAFALAHAARWMLAHDEREADRASAARASTLALRDRASAWERSHIETLAAILDGDPNAWTLASEHLVAHPLDLIIASQLVGHLFFHAGEGKRAATMDLLEGLAPQQGDDWAFAARLGFHMSELGRPRAAIAILEAALRARPQAPFVAHALSHALLESGQRAASYRFLLDWVSQHDAAGPLDGHIHWHLALGELEQRDPAAALERYRAASAPGASHCADGLMLADAGGLLFRMVLDGASVDDVPRGSLRELVARLDGALGVPFVAVHAAALAAALGDGITLDRCLEALDRSARAGEAAAHHLVVTAFKAYAAGDMAACVGALERDRKGAWEAIGGSNEERALFSKLYAHAQQQRTAPITQPA